MKKLIFLLFLVPSSLFAQNSSFGLYFSFDQTNRENYYDIMSTSWTYDLITYPEIDFKTGITFTQLVSKRISIQTGLLYSNKDFSILYNCDVCESTLDASNKVWKHRYLSAPIQIEYRVLKGKLSPIANLGIINNFNLKDELYDAKNYFLDGVVGVGLNYELNDSISLNALYSYSKPLSDVYKEEQLQPNILSTNSFALHVNYSLN